jgi:hypothetical protein
MRNKGRRKVMVERDYYYFFLVLVVFCVEGDKGEGENRERGGGEG